MRIADDVATRRERVGDAVDGPTNFPERFVGGGAYCAIMIGADVASAIQPVGEEVTTYDPGTETYTTEIVGQGTVLATQVINNSAAAAYDNTRSRYLVFDQSESLWWVEDSETPTFVSRLEKPATTLVDSMAPTSGMLVAVVTS